MTELLGGGKLKSMNTIHPKQHKGFTLVELLIVIVIIGILAAISVVAYNGITDKANDSVVQQELAQMYKHVKAEEVMKDTDFYSENYNYYKGSDYIENNKARLSIESRSHLESWLGAKPSQSSLYNKSNDASIALVRKWDSSDVGTLVIYARSKSGKVFVYDGSLTQVIADNNEEQRAYLEETLANLEEFLRLGDACVASPSTCVGPDGDKYEWTAETTSLWNSYQRQYYVSVIDKVRDSLEGILTSIMGFSDLGYYASDDTWWIGNRYGPIVSL